MSADEFFRRANSLGTGNDRSSLVERLPQLSGREVYANVDLSLEYISTYGFDLDFTLAGYNTSVLSQFIYAEAREYLVEQLGYPSELLRKTKFDPYFAIRGLFFDKTRGYLLKVGQFGQVSPTCVLQGRSVVPPERVLEAYPGYRVSKEYLAENCHMYVDLFCLSEMSLISDCIEHFSGLTIDPAHVFADVRAAIGHVHASGRLYNEVMRAPDLYLGDVSADLSAFLERLRVANKRTFLLTNSPPFYVNAVMRHLTQNENWAELFDVVACSARKPSFYGQGSRPFRKLDASGKHLSLEQVTHFERGQIYVQGSMDRLLELSGLNNDDTIYFGDQIYADLVAPSRRSVRTAAIISELRHEVNAQGMPEYRRALGLLLELNELIMAGQEIAGPSACDVHEAVARLKKRRAKARRLLKEIVNPAFGSAFRTDQGRTLWFHHVGRHADIYTSDVLNLSQYALDHCFYSERRFMPHEVVLPSSAVASLLTQQAATNTAAVINALAGQGGAGPSR